MAAGRRPRSSRRSTPRRRFTSRHFFAPIHPRMAPVGRNAAHGGNVTGLRNRLESSRTLPLEETKFMPINADKPHLWKADTRASVDQFNEWFMAYAPKAYRETRGKTVEHVERGLLATEDLTRITPDIIRASPAILPTLRMSTCPPLARDRLIGLADSNKNLVGCLEEGKLPSQLSTALLNEHLGRITGIISRMLDVDIFPWLAEKRRPTEEERYRSSTIVADRLCGAVADPIVRNAQEKRQLAAITQYLGVCRR